MSKLFARLLLILALIPAAEGTSSADPADPALNLKAMIQAGQLEAAEFLLNQWSVSHPGDVETLFLLGIIARRQGRLPEAAVRFRQALDRQPNATRIRLELAGTLYLARRDEEADYHFRLAIAEHPPVPVLSSIARFREAIRARRAWRFNVNLAIAPDSNINAAPSTDRIDILGFPFQLDPSARARSGVGLITAGDASLRLRRNSKMPVFLAAYGRMVRYREDQFDDLYVGGAAGPEFVLSEGRFRISATGLRRWHGHRQLLTSVGSQLHFDKIIKSGLGLDASLAARRLRYVGRRDLDSWEYEAYVAANRAVSPSTLGFTSFTVQRSGAKDPAQSSWLSEFRGAVLKEMQWGWRPQVSIELQRQINDRRNELFGRVRRDWRVEVSASIYKRDWNVAGFAPSVRVSWTRNWSTIRLYDQKRLRIEAGVAKAF